MIARRLTGMLLALLMAHLTLVGADLACATHGAGPATARQHSAMATHHDGMSMLGREGVVSATKLPCETPTQPACCRAMTSCALSATFQRVERVASPLTVHGVIEPATTRAPLSPITSPDPPPPKA